MNQDDQDKRILKAASKAKVFEFIDTEQALLDTKEKLGIAAGAKSHGINWPQVIRIAASITILFSIGWAVYLTQFAPKWTTYSSGDSMKEYKLSDGSVISLNKYSTVRVNENMRSKREIELDGEAFFEVRRDEDRPFVINTSDLEIAVLGTSFNVLSTQTMSTVSVASGRVSVAPHESIVSEILTKNEAITFISKSGELTRQTSDPNYLAWKTGKYTFKDIPIGEALAILAKGKNIRIQFDEDFGQNCKITSEFDNQTWEEIINEFTLLHSLEFLTRSSGVVVVKGGNCE